MALLNDVSHTYALTWENEKGCSSLALGFNVYIVDS